MWEIHQAGLGPSVAHRMAVRALLAANHPIQSIDVEPLQIDDGQVNVTD
jgi:hypothetical protein